MSYFTQLHVALPPIVSPLSCPGRTNVSIINSLYILNLLDLPWKTNEIRLIQVWVAPHTRVEIHKDADAITGEHQLWGLLLPVVNHISPIAEVYTAIDETTKLSTPYETGPVPFLSFDNAKLEEAYDVSRGPAFFDSGTQWHSARNNTDMWHHCLSVRSRTIPKKVIYDQLLKRWNKNQTIG